MLNKDDDLSSYPYKLTTIVDGIKMTHQFRPIRMPSATPATGVITEAPVMTGRVLPEIPEVSISHEETSVTSDNNSNFYVSPTRIAREFLISNHVEGFNANIHYTVSDLMSRFSIRNNSDVWQMLDRLIAKGIMHKVEDTRNMQFGRRQMLYYYTDPAKMKVVEDTILPLKSARGVNIQSPFKHRGTSLRKYLYDNADFFNDNPQCFNSPYIMQATGSSQNHVWSTLQNLVYNGLASRNQVGDSKSLIIYKWTEAMLAVAGVFKVDDSIETKVKVEAAPVVEEQPITLEPEVKAKDNHPTRNLIHDLMAVLKAHEASL